MGANAVARDIWAPTIGATMKRHLGRGVPIVLATVLALDGCGTGNFVTLKPDQLGTVGVVSTTCANVRMGAPPIPGVGAGAARGARVAASTMVDAAIEVTKGGAGGGQGALVALAASLVIVALVPVGAGVGAVVGAIGAESAERVARADATLRAALPRLDPAQAIRRHLLEVIRARSLPTFIMVDEKRVAGLTDFAALKEDGIDTILELDSITLSLAGPEPREHLIDPKHKFRMDIHARLLRPDGSRLHEKTFDVTVERRFVDWAAHDAQELLIVTDRAAGELAEEIVDRYMLRPIRVDPDLANEPPAFPKRCPLFEPGEPPSTRPV